jgi:hypothetical protein
MTYLYWVSSHAGQKEGGIADNRVAHNDAKLPFRLKIRLARSAGYDQMMCQQSVKE